MALTECFNESNINFCVTDSGDVVVGDNETSSGAFNNYEFKHLVIPEYANGKKVIEIGRNSFSHKNTIISVTILAQITQINEHAFFSCCSLSYINIPPSVKLICHLALSFKNGDSTSNGTTKIVFDYPASISCVENYGIERKENFIIYFNGKKAPKFLVGPFFGSKKVVVYSPVKMNFGGVRTTVLTSFCQTRKQKSSYSHCYTFILLNFISS